MTVTTSDADWAAICAERDRLAAEVVELRRHDAASALRFRALDSQAREAALWRSQLEDAQRMLTQLRGELGRERGLRVNAVAACMAARARVATCSFCQEEPELRALDLAIAEAERHG